jgi:tetratricopeptide (TPR) repeat protein
MGRSIGAASEASAASFFHRSSRTRATVEGRLHRLERGGLIAEHRVQYRIGSGAHAAGFLVRVGEWLFQSPLALYSSGRWDVAPGYENFERIDFNRRVTQECLDCHSNGDAANPQPIACRQCHGDPAQHLTKPGRGNINKPHSNESCESCHLMGEARVAGQVFVYDRPRQDLRVVSHVEQFALSNCSKDGQLWCASCHAVHGAKIDVNQKCQSCHTPHDNHAECVSCHMPKRKASDGGHSAFTDHRIQKRPAPPITNSSPKLRAWRGTPDERALGLAELQVGERDGSEALIQQGYRRLAAGIARWDKDAEVVAALGLVLFWKDQKADAGKLLEAAVKLKPSDAMLHEKLGLIQRALGDLESARQNFSAAISLDPSSERAYFLLAECQPTIEQRTAVLQQLLRRFPQSLLAREALTRP